MSQQIDAKVFLNDESARDVGSSCASMNRTGKTNAKKGPKVDYNAYKDFHDREIDAHIAASFMKFAGMTSISGKWFNILVVFEGQHCREGDAKDKYHALLLVFQILCTIL